MPLYEWKGKNRYGDIVQGKRIARSAEGLAKSLQREQVVVEDIKRTRAELKNPLSSTAESQAKRFGYLQQTAFCVDRC